MFLSNADLFGYSLKPTFKGQSKINTVLGGIVSILLVSLFTFSFFFVGKEIVEKKNPISNVSAIRVNEASIALKEVPLIFSLVSSGGEFLQLNKEFMRAIKIDTALYEISTTANGQYNFSKFNVPLVFCTKELLGEEYYATAKLNQAGIDFALCIDYNNVTAQDGSKYPGTPKIKNPFGSQKSANLGIIIQVCDENQDPGCRKGLETAGSFSFVVIHPQNNLDISNNSNPTFTTVKLIQTNAFVGLAFNQEFNFNVNELVSDEGWILEQNKTKTFYTVDPPIYNATQYSESLRMIGRVTFAVNLTKNVINRRYMKLQELIANLGGFIKVVMMIFSFLFKNYSKWTLYKEIIKSSSPAPNPVAIGNLIHTSATTIKPTEKTLRPPTFLNFTLALVSKSQAKARNIHWDDTLKYLDLLYVKKKFEEMNSEQDNSNEKAKP